MLECACPLNAPLTDQKMLELFFSVILPASGMVVTHDLEPVREYISNDLHRGATLWKGQGAYTGQEQTIILAALSRHQAMQLRNYLRQHDAHAFMLITNSSEIFGKGFLTP